MNENNHQTPQMNWRMLQTRLESFAKKLEEALEELAILEECKELDIDHICVRLGNYLDVDNLKKELGKVGQIISAVNVNGREIMIIQLNQTLKIGSWQTRAIELPYPKENHNYEDGWEHVEFVLGEAENTIEGVRKAFVNRFENLDLKQLKSEYSYSEDEPQAESDQIPNPTIGLKVNGVGLKFHANSIQSVVGFKG